ncbi:asparaginase [Paenibacillus sp. J45TS6]|uniref:asparaginase n=1 Tax=Paenibacillus sp. J45TS6 TaxID=2807196 RepID=UPI001B11B57B|nr:asparaginase [Paenibacillus sp. J45TS6]GIP45200.1 asparaginase [Paenibacillus sp. J45TS6]
MTDTMLIKEFRSGVLESAHRGHICIVNDKKQVVYSVGNPHFRTFTRSAAKPLQAIPGIRAGIVDAYDFSQEEIALMVSSHRSEAFHRSTLEQMKEKINLDEGGLVCAPSFPLHEESRTDYIRQQGDKRRLLHNCSGKHMGVLAYSKLKGYDLASYADPNHPVQQEIKQIISQLGEIDPSDMAAGVDGCGFPVFALPISTMATAFLKLACPDLIEDEETRKAAEVITAAMNKAPEMVGGTGRVDSVLLHDDNIVAKGGFQGVFCLALRKERLGISFKVLDGSDEEWGLIVKSILTQIGYDNAETIQRLTEQFPGEIRNDARTVVGKAESAFILESHA